MVLQDTIPKHHDYESSRDLFLTDVTLDTWKKTQIVAALLHKILKSSQIWLLKIDKHKFLDPYKAKKFKIKRTPF